MGVEIMKELFRYMHAKILLYLFICLGKNRHICRRCTTLPRCHCTADKKPIICPVTGFPPPLKSFLICAVVATVQRRHQSSVMWLKRCRPLPSRLCTEVKVTAGREGAWLACAAGDTKRSLQTSHRSTQTKRYSCNSGAAEQQSAGSVGGFSKKRVSLCALLDFGSAKRGAGFRVDDMQQRK